VGASTGARAVRAKKALFVIADDHLRLAVFQEAHDVVRETVLVDAVAETDQFVDISHQGQSLRQSGPVAMNVRDNTQLHARSSINVGDNAGRRLSPRRRV